MTSSQIFFTPCILFTDDLDSISISFACFVFYHKDKNNTNKRIKLKISLVAIGLTFFSIFALPNIVGAFIPFEQHLRYFFLLIGPTIASVISSFLTAEGYTKTLKENLNVIKGNDKQPQESPGNRTTRLKLSKSNF